MVRFAELQEFARRYTHAWSSHDPAGVASFHSTSSSLAVNGGVPAVGRQAIEEVARGFMTTFPDLALRMDGIEADGDRARFLWTLTGTNSGPEAPGSASPSAALRSGG